MENTENLEYCKRCGGYCCKKCGCDYSAKDFENLSLNGLCKILKEGNISVVSYLEFIELKSGRIVADPFLYLRARNKNRDIIDLLSLKTTCSMLTEDGCTYDKEHRPSVGLNLIPGESRFECKPNERPIDIINTWKPYQNTLKKIVKRYTNMTVENKLRQDVENLFIDVLNQNFEEVALEEKVDVLTMLPLLIEAYPKEFRICYQNYQNKSLSNIKAKRK